MKWHITGWQVVAGLALLALLWFLAPGARAASPLWVDDNWATVSDGTVVAGHTIGADAFGSIQRAVNTAHAGDVIKVYPGIYRENVNVDTAVTIYAIGGPSVTRLDARKLGHGFAIGAAGVTITGFEIVNADGGAYAGILVGGDFPGQVMGLRGITLSANTVHSCTNGILLASTGSGLTNTLLANTVYSCTESIGAGGVGILLWGEDSLGNSDCQLLDNVSYGNSAQGILVGAGSSAAMSRRNLLQGNEAHHNGMVGGTRGQGIHLRYASDNTLLLNTLRDHTLGSGATGLLLDAATQNTVLYNDLHANTEGVLLINGSARNALRGNKIIANSGWGARVSDEGSTSSILSGNRITGNATGTLRNDGSSPLSATLNYIGRSTDPLPVFSGLVQSEPRADGWLYPGDDPTIAVGQLVTLPVKVWVDDLYGFQLQERYDTAPLDYAAHAWDSSWFHPDHVQWDCLAGEAAGLLRIAATQLYPDHPSGVSGDEKKLLDVTFRGMAAGRSVISFTDTVASSVEGDLLRLASGATTVIVGGQRASLSGQVQVQGRPDVHWDGAQIMALGGDGNAYSTLSDTSGNWSLSLPVGTYDVFVEMPLYLDAAAEGVVVPAAGKTLALVKVLGGDANDDDIVDILDLAIIGGQFGRLDGAITNRRADINDDDAVDILDLSIAGGNYTKTYAPWMP